MNNQIAILDDMLTCEDADLCLKVTWTCGEFQCEENVYNSAEVRVIR